ncbi:mediator of RNA polymerase II transcription subunit 8 isoform X2 [Brachypodium distachyon]|uniref:mediator of RNA polymerase II transcription subunit 8 isoform X2 n=1 Tax=Brachypodium distachyon TaxID=15368 RepID=UPI00052FE2BC|nr:mediator of RNA polymerase II transcription subunit 8 isoform X2 [Brachypodium distachyon]|eukprot:XP_010238496.1 mediator of RNA polymerase II transcription subunit 8 isoform X2 [Brachypodium distachyon]
MDAAAAHAAGAPAGEQQAAAPRAERLNQGVHHQLNLEGMRARAVGLYKAISRIIDDFNNIARTTPGGSPKWQDVLGQFSMVSMELFNIVEDIKKVNKGFVVYPRNVNAENALILPVMLSSKLLPEMEIEETTKREQLLSGITNLPVPSQMEKLKARIDMIASACETAERVIAECRKTYGLGTRQGANLGPTLDKAQAAKIQEQEGLLRAAVNYGEGLRVPGDQRQPHSSLPSHLMEVLPSGDGAHNFGVYPKNTSTFTPNGVNTQGNAMQASGGLGRSAPSPGTAGTPNFENVSTPPMPYANSPRSGTNMMNTPSPQQHLTPQQQRQKLMQASQQQQLHAQQQQQQQLRPSAASLLAQNTVSQLQDLQGQSQQKLQVPGQQQMQYSQAQALSQFQNRQMQAARMQPGMSQSQLNQGNQLRSHLGQFTGAANSAMFTAAQASSNSQMMANIPGTMQSLQSQSILPQMQFGLTGGHPQRSHPTQMMNDQMFGMGSTNTSSMMGMQQQQQQQQQQGVYGNMQGGGQNLQQQGMVGLQNQQNQLQNQMQNPNFPQQRQQNQQ